MKNVLLILAFLPSLLFAQSKKGKEAQKMESGVFQVTGTVSGYPEGTTVDLVNPNNGTPLASTTLKDGQFTFSGKMDFPDLRVISFNKAPDQSFPIFLDNSKVTVKAQQGALQNVEIKGSQSHADFHAFSVATQPFQHLFAGTGAGSPDEIKAAAAVLEDYVRKNKNAYISPLAVFRNYQLTEDAKLMEELYKSLHSTVQQTPLGQYVASQIEEANRNPIGSILPDFSQEDTEGKLVKLSDFKGKYVLVDFWASWCRPCREENPNVVNAFHTYKNKNFTVLGVSLDKSRDPWLAAIQKDQLTWANVSDLKGWGNEVAQKFQIYSIPQNFLVDPNGVLIGKNLRGAALNEKLAALIK